jgi:hypothetical protein
MRLLRHFARLATIATLLPHPGKESVRADREVLAGGDRAVGNSASFP